MLLRRCYHWCDLTRIDISAPKYAHMHTFLIQVKWLCCVLFGIFLPIQLVLLVVKTYMVKDFFLCKPRNEAAEMTTVNIAAQIFSFFESMIRVYMVYAVCNSSGCRHFGVLFFRLFIFCAISTELYVWSMLLFVFALCRYVLQFDSINCFLFLFSVYCFALWI